MRVLSILVGATTRAGGVAAFAGGAAAALERLGHEAPVLATDLALAPQGYLQRQTRAREADLHPDLRGRTQLVRCQVPRRLAYAPGLGRALRAEVPRADLVHIHNLWLYPQYAAFRAAERSDVPYVVSTHGALDHYLRATGRGRKALTDALWQRRMLANAAALHVTTTDELAAVADAAPGVPRFVVPCGVTTSDFSVLPPREAFRRRCLDGYDGLLVTFLGRVTAKKGLDVLIRAFARARASVECKLAVVGPDDEGLLPSLRALSEALGVAGDVVFTGPQYGDDRLAVLSATDVWALSSHTENFGIAVIEALAAGCPVILTPGVSVAGEIGAARAGVIAAADPVAFGEALRAILEDPQERTRLRSGAAGFAERYDWDAVGPRLAEAYAPYATGVDRGG